MNKLDEKQWTHFHTIRSIMETGKLTEREQTEFMNRYLTLQQLSSKDKVAIRKQIVEWQAAQAKKEGEKRRLLERQRTLAELEAESKPIQREPRTLREKMQRKGWTVS